MKENLLAKVYVDLLGMSKEAATAQELLRWKLPAKGGKGPVADFAEILYDKLKTRSSVRTWSMLMISDVNRQLDVLSRDKAAGKQVLQFFFERCTPLEQKWLIRIIVKDLRIGMTERVILPIFHPDAYTLFTHASNLRKVCEELQDPNKRVSSKIRLELFHPFRPMLCKRLENVKTVLRDMNHHPFWIERKLDGERAQLHKKGNDYRYWSRKATDYTFLYGADKTTGSLTPYIDRAFNKDVKTCILDGEMVEYNPATKNHVPFGTLKTAASDHASQGDDRRPCFIAFDCLYVNGESKMDMKLEDRYELLKLVIAEEIPGRIEIHPHIVGTTVTDVTDALERIIEESGEGVVVKNPKSIYQISERAKEWLKSKPEYIGSLVDDFDVLCIGGYYGKGSRAGLIGAFLCAVLESDYKQTQLEDPVFLTFCKVGSGYTRELLQELNDALAPYQKRFIPAKCPSWLKFPPNLKEKPDVYFPYEHGKIFQVRGAEMIMSTSFATGWTLRFPHLNKPRSDKDWRDCMTYPEVMAKRASTNQRRAITDRDLASSKRRSRKSLFRSVTVQLHKAFDTSEATGVQAVDNLLEGTKFS